MRVHDVLIAGAGPVGLLLGMLLGEAGFAVQIVAPCGPAPDEDASAILLPPTLEALDHVGLAAAITARGTVLTSQRVTMHGTGETAFIDFASLAGHTSHPHVVATELRHVREALTERLAGCPNVRIQRGARIVRLTQSDDHVNVELDVLGIRFVDRAQFVAGCDASGSVVRDLAGLSFDEAGTAETLTLAPLPPTPGDADAAGIFLLESGAEIEVIPLGRTRRVSIASSQAGRGELAAIAGDGTAFYSSLAVRNAPAAASRLELGRIVLAGDAAHRLRPESADAFNTGFHDAMELADALIATLHQPSNDRLLALYGRRRSGLVRELVAEEGSAIRSRRQSPEARFANWQALALDPDAMRALLMRHSMVSKQSTSAVLA